EAVALEQSNGVAHGHNAHTELRGDRSEQQARSGRQLAVQDSTPKLRVRVVALGQERYVLVVSAHAHQRAAVPAACRSSRRSRRHSPISSSGSWPAMSWATSFPVIGPAELPYTCPAATTSPGTGESMIGNVSDVYGSSPAHIRAIGAWRSPGKSASKPWTIAASPAKVGCWSSSAG